MADLDAAGQTDFAAVLGALALDHAADVGHGFGFGQVAAPVDAGDVEARLVGADDEVGHRRDLAVGDHADRPLRADRAEEAGLAAEVVEDFRLAGHAVVGHAGHLLKLDLVDLVVAAHQRQHEAVLGHQRHRFHGALQRQAEQRGHVLAGFLGGRGDLAQVFAGGRARRGRGGAGGFDVGRVVRAGGKHDGVLAGGGQHLEFHRGIAADRAGIGLHGAEVQPEAGEHAGVGGVHVPVLAGQVIGVEVERIGVLHQEFARAHHAEARADLVAELGLDLVEVDRQLLVAGQLLAGEIGDRLLGRRAVAVFLLLAVADLQQLAAELLPAAGFLPQLARLDGGQQQFDRAGAVHFLAHHALDLAQHAQAQRGPRVQAGGELADHAGAQHQLVADQLGVGRGFLGGTQVEPGKAHRTDLEGV